MVGGLFRLDGILYIDGVLTFNSALFIVNKILDSTSCQPSSTLLFPNDSYPLLPKNVLIWTAHLESSFRLLLINVYPDGTMNKFRLLCFSRTISTMFYNQHHDNGSVVMYHSKYFTFNNVLECLTESIPTERYKSGC